jgi:hypothetical protein
VSLPDGVIEIGAAAFLGAGLERVRLPRTLARVGEGAFKDCGRLREVEFEQGPGGGPGAGTGGMPGEAGEGLPPPKAPPKAPPSEKSPPKKSLKKSPARGKIHGKIHMEVSSMQLCGGGVSSLGARAFQNCSSLLAFAVPPGVACVPASLLSGCTALAALTFHAGVTELGARAFEECEALETLVVPPKVAALPE